MTDDELRDLDMQVAAEVMGLQGVGWYKRKSCREPGWEAATGPEDHTADCPTWAADRYYLADGQTVCIPYYSTAPRDTAHVVTQMMLRSGREVAFHQRVKHLAGTPLKATPEMLCRAAIDVMRDSDAIPANQSDEARWNALIFHEEEEGTPEELLAALTGAVREMATARYDLAHMTMEARGLGELLKRVEDSLTDVTRGCRLLFDRPDQAIRAVGRQRDRMAEALRKIDPENEVLQEWMPLDEWETLKAEVYGT